MINLPSSARSLLVIGLVAYLLFAVVKFPASLAIAWFLPDEISAAAVGGTVWSGYAGAIVTPHVTLVDTTWRARPLSLFTAKMSYRLKTTVAGGAIESTAAFSPDGTIRLKQLSGVLPLSALPGIDPTITVEGRMGLDLEQLLIEDQWPTDAIGTVDIVNLNVVTIMSPVGEALGSFEVIFAGAGESGLLEGQISAVDGPLVVSGTLSLHNDRKWNIAGTVKPTAEASAQLSQGLAFVGSRNPDGSYNLSYPAR